MKDLIEETFKSMIVILFTLVLFAPYIVHIAWWFKAALNSDITLNAEQLLLAVAGAIVPLFGWIHGIILIFS